MRKKASGVIDTTNSALRIVSITVNIASNVSEKAKNMSNSVCCGSKNIQWDSPLHLILLSAWILTSMTADCLGREMLQHSLRQNPFDISTSIFSIYQTVEKKAHGETIHRQRQHWVTKYGSYRGVYSDPLGSPITQWQISPKAKFRFNGKNWFEV